MPADLASFGRLKPISSARCFISSIAIRYCILAYARLICARVSIHMLQAEVAQKRLHTSGRDFATAEVQLVPKGDRATARRHREWLRAVSEQTGLPPTTLAKKIKISPSTLTRPLAEGDDGTSTLHAATIEKIVAFTGIAGPAAAMPIGLPPAGLREDAAPYLFEHDDPIGSAIRILAGGKNGINPWTLKTRALELEGFMPGDVVLIDLNRDPADGDIVCAQISDWPQRRPQTVMRVYQRAKPVRLLIGRSLDPTFAQTYVVDDDRVVIKGVLLPHRLRPKS